MPKLSESTEEDFLALRMVTFLKRMESRGSVEGGIGHLSENIERNFRREGSKKAVSSLGLDGKVFTSEPEESGEGEVWEAKEVRSEG